MLIRKFCWDYLHNFLLYNIAIYSETGETHIESQKLDGTNRRRIYSMKHIECNGIVYDWIGNNIFIATPSKIDVISLNTGPVAKTLIVTKRLLG